LYHGRDVPFASEDLDALHALWTDPDVRRYLWDDIVISRERAAETVDDALTTAAVGLGAGLLGSDSDRSAVQACGHSERGFGPCLPGGE
jgi:hypothetical protein